MTIRTAACVGIAGVLAIFYFAELTQSGCAAPLSHAVVNEAMMAALPMRLGDFVTRHMATINDSELQPLLRDYKTQFASAVNHAVDHPESATSAADLSNWAMRFEAKVSGERKTLATAFLRDLSRAIVLKFYQGHTGEAPAIKAALEAMGPTLETYSPGASDLLCY